MKKIEPIKLKPGQYSFVVRKVEFIMEHHTAHYMRMGTEFFSEKWYIKVESVNDAKKPWVQTFISNTFRNENNSIISAATKTELLGRINRCILLLPDTKNNFPDWEGFVSHLYEYNSLGIPTSMSLLHELAKKYNTPPPARWEGTKPIFDHNTYKDWEKASTLQS